MLTETLFALFVMTGGTVNSGYLTQLTPIAYFATKDECEAVAKHIIELNVVHYDQKRYAVKSWVCVPGKYRAPK